jgi:hypothetical protein
MRPESRRDPARLRLSGRAFCPKRDVSAWNHHPGFWRIRRMPAPKQPRPMTRRVMVYATPPSPSVVVTAKNAEPSARKNREQRPSQRYAALAADRPEANVLAAQRLWVELTINDCPIVASAAVDYLISIAVVNP